MALPQLWNAFKSLIAMVEDLKNQGEQNNANSAIQKESDRIAAGGRPDAAGSDS